MTAHLEAGATVVELLIAVILVVIAVLAGGALIVQSARLDRSVVESLRFPDGELALGWIRQDVHGSAALVNPTVSWSHGPLRLRGFSGGEVVFAPMNDLLIRRDVDEDGVEISRRFVARRLAGWRWRSPTARLIEVELRGGSSTDRLRVYGEMRPAEQSGRALRTVRGLMALRSSGARSW